MGRPPLKFGEIDPAVEGQTVCMVCRASPAERCICGACEPTHKYERIGTLRGCRETTDGYHVVEAEDNVCILCFSKLGGSPVRVPIKATK